MDEADILDGLRCVATSCSALISISLLVVRTGFLFSAFARSLPFLLYAAIS